MVPSGTRLLSSVKADCRHLSKVATTCTRASHPGFSATTTYHTSVGHLPARSDPTERDNSRRAKTGQLVIDKDSRWPILGRRSRAKKAASSIHTLACGPLNSLRIGMCFRTLQLPNHQMLENASDECFRRKRGHRVRPVFWPREARPAGETRPSGCGTVHSCSKPGTFLRRPRATRRGPRFRLRSELPQRFIERLLQVPGCRAKSEQIQGTSQMRSASRNLPDHPQRKLKGTGTVTSDFRDDAIDIIPVPATITLDQEGRARVDRQAYSVTQSRCGIQLLQDGGRGPRHFLRPGQRIENFRCLQEEMIVNPDNAQATLIEFASKQLNVRGRPVKKNCPTRLWARYRHRKRHDRL